MRIILKLNEMKYQILNAKDGFMENWLNGSLVAGCWLLGIRV